jgi:sec-independent protein translocase protein TatB
MLARASRHDEPLAPACGRRDELDELKKFKSTFEEAARSVESTVHTEMQKTENELSSLAQLGEPPPPGAGSGS